MKDVKNMFVNAIRWDVVNRDIDKICDILEKKQGKK
jgi:hypothetical protein